MKPIAFSLFLALATASVSAANPVDWVVGDVVVAAGNGSYQVWHSANPNAAKPVYTKLTTVSDPVGGTTAGCTFDSAYRLFATDFTNTNSEVVRFSVDAGHGTVPSNATAPGLTKNESLAFDAAGNFFVGYAGTSVSTAGLAKFNHNGGTPITFSPPVENDGVDWIDLDSDQQTVFYTSEGRKIFRFNTVGSAPPVYADLSTLSGSTNQGKLFAIRILPPGADKGGVLVADQTNVKLVKASGGVITSVQVFKFKNESNLQALSLDPTNPARFWVGDATTNDLIQFDMSTGKTVVTLNTGTGTSLGGVCVDGGFSAAQNFAPPADGTHTKSLDSAHNTISFTNTATGVTFVATLANLTTPVTATVHDSLVDPSVGASDPEVMSFNPPEQGSVVFQGPVPCDQTFTPDACEVFEFETNPALPSGVVSNVQICSSKACTTDDSSSLYPNPRLLRNLDEDITDGVNTYPLSGTRSNCVYTVNKQTFTPGAQSCGFQSPVQGQTFTKTQGSSLPFKFVASSGTCPPSTSTALGAGAITPLLMITKLVPQATDGSLTAPISEMVIVKGNSGGFPIFAFSGNTWQLQVDSSNLPVGNYLATVIDLQNVIPAFGVNFTLQ